MYIMGGDIPSGSFNSKANCYRWKQKAAAYVSAFIRYRTSSDPSIWAKYLGIATLWKESPKVSRNLTRSKKPKHIIQLMLPRNHALDQIYSY